MCKTNERTPGAGGRVALDWLNSQINPIQL